MVSNRSASVALEKTRKAIAARDELMGIVAHDLRSPLNAITMKAALLKRGGDIETARQAESIESIATRMEYLIRTMLDVAVIEAGMFSVTPTRCDVDGVLSAALDMFGSVFGVKQIRFDVSASEPGLTMMADHERVLQVLSNLIGNALKFTPQGGEVNVSATRHGEAVCFTVTDTGPGIAGDTLPRIFERFWKDTTRAQKGTGLGLFIARSIVEAQGGRIWVTSEHGSGSTFRFTIPVAKVESAASVHSDEGGRVPVHV